MHIVLTAKSDVQASCLRSKIVSFLSPDARWRYRSFSASEDVIYEEAIYSGTADNFMSDGRPYLLFVMELENDKVMFFPASFRDAQNTDFMLCCRHLGNLTETLLSNFHDDFIRFEIVK